MAKIVFTRSDPDRSFWVQQYDRGDRGARALVHLDLASDEVIRPGVGCTWTAPNGLIVLVSDQHYGCSFHSNCGYHDHVGRSGSISSWENGQGWQAVAPHRHIGPQRRALRAFAKECVVKRETANFLLRRMVRPGD